MKIEKLELKRETVVKFVGEGGYLYNTEREAAHSFLLEFLREGISEAGGSTYDFETTKAAEWLIDNRDKIRAWFDQLDETSAPLFDFQPQADLP